MTHNNYYIDYPRGFVNEYRVYVIPSHLAKEFEESFARAGRISRKEAIRLAVTRPREAKRNGEQWFGGWYSRFEPLTGNTEEQIERCKQETLLMPVSATW